MQWKPSSTITHSHCLCHWQVKFNKNYRWKSHFTQIDWLKNVIFQLIAVTAYTPHPNLSFACGSVCLCAYIHHPDFDELMLTVHPIVYTSSELLPTGVSLQRQQYHFAFDKLTQERPSKIELLLYQLDGSVEVDNMQMAEISYKMKVDSRYVSIPLVTTTIHPSRRGYQTVDITTDNPQWLQNAKGGKVELLVTVFSESSNSVQQGLTKNAARFSINTDNHTTAPRLVLMSEIASTHRRKRDTHGLSTSNVQECRPDDPTACCRRPLRINFKKDLQIDYIFEPREIDIGYCDGHCRHHRQDYYNIITHVTSRRGDIDTVRPCCVPNAFRNVTVTTMINGKVGPYQLTNLKIISCGCTWDITGSFAVTAVLQRRCHMSTHMEEQVSFEL